MLSAKRERFKDAFKIGAYRFVTKPIDILELEEAINDAEKTLLGYSSINAIQLSIISVVFCHREPMFFMPKNFKNITKNS